MTTDEKIKQVIFFHNEWKKLKPLLRSQERVQKEFGDTKSNIVLDNMRRKLTLVEEELKRLLPDDW